MSTTFSILITTKNRKADLSYSLEKLKRLIARDDVECMVFDDGSTDGTSELVSQHNPKIQLFRNESSKGLMHCRNRMLNATTAKYAISLDDDAHFLTENPLEKIATHFSQNPGCGAIAFRIWWNKEDNQYVPTFEENEVVKGFVGCGHAWNTNIWRQIENYPEWFEFYGEEDFASMHLFKKGLTVDYVPEILVQHRVDLTARAIVNKDGGIRYRKAFRAGWYLYFIFYPFSKIPKRLAYSLFMQLKLRVFNGNFKAVFPLMRAITDVAVNSGKLKQMRQPFTPAEFLKYSKLPESKIYWKPEKSYPKA